MGVRGSLGRPITREKERREQRRERLNTEWLAEGVKCCSSQLRHPPTDKSKRFRSRVSASGPGRRRPRRWGTRRDVDGGDFGVSTSPERDSGLPPPDHRQLGPRPTHPDVRLEVDPASFPAFRPRPSGSEQTGVRPGPRRRFPLSARPTTPPSSPVLPSPVTRARPRTGQASGISAGNRGLVHGVSHPKVAATSRLFGGPSFSGKRQGGRFHDFTFYSF